MITDPAALRDVLVAQLQVLPTLAVAWALFDHFAGREPDDAGDDVRRTISARLGIAVAIFGMLVVFFGIVRPDATLLNMPSPRLDMVAAALSVGMAVGMLFSIGSRALDATFPRDADRARAARRSNWAFRGALVILIGVFALLFGFVPGLTITVRP